MLCRSVAGNSVADHLCYMGVSLEAENWASCSFILSGNPTETLNGGLVIQIPISST